MEVACTCSFFPGDEPVQFADGTQVLGVVRVELRGGGGPPADVTAITAADATATGIAQVELSREGPVQHDIDLLGLGDAHLDASGGSLGSLRVNNLGSSGLDGVRMHSDSDGVRAELQPLGALAIGDRMIFSTTGTVADVPGVELGSVTIEQVGASVDFTPDYSPVGVSTYTVQVLLGDTVLSSSSGHSGVVLSASIPPCKVIVSTIWFIDGPSCCEFGWPFVFVADVPGVGTFNADKIIILPENGPDAQLVESLALTASGLSEFTLLDAGIVEDDHIGLVYCGPAVPNSTGLSGAISATGSDVVADNDVTLAAAQLPPNRFGFFIISQTQGFISNPGGSQGNLCLAGQIGRYSRSGEIQNSGAGGAFSLVIDLTDTPQPSGGPVSILPGETWNFTTWYRDVNPTATSNFTDGLSIVFQ